MVCEHHARRFAPLLHTCVRRRLACFPMLPPSEQASDTIPEGVSFHMGFVPCGKFRIVIPFSVSHVHSPSWDLVCWLQFQNREFRGGCNGSKFSGPFCNHTLDPTTLFWQATCHPVPASSTGPALAPTAQGTAPATQSTATTADRLEAPPQYKLDAPSTEQADSATTLRFRCLSCNRDSGAACAPPSTC